MYKEKKKEKTNNINKILLSGSPFEKGIFMKAYNDLYLEFT